MNSNLLNKLRFKLFLLTKTFDYSENYLKQIYKIYLNHNKIIHFRDGYPVYSLSTPAVFSKPAANLFARSFFRSVQNKNMPNLLSFAVCDVCNINCQHCSFYTSVDNKKKKVLTLQECKNVIKQAQELGVSVIDFVGGEPLLRKDLPEIISSVDKDLSTTVLFTNGLLLKEKAKKLKQSGLDSVYISIDASNPKQHDIIRRKPGLFNQAVEGIKTAKKIGMSVGISCCLTPESFAKGEFIKMVKLSRKLAVHELLIFDAIPVGRLKNQKNLINNHGWTDQMISQSQKYNNDPTYPGILIYAYATSHMSVGCVCGTSYLYISPYGDIMPCDFNHKIYGNIKKMPLYQIWDKMTCLPEYHQAQWGGCRLKR